RARLPAEHARAPDGCVVVRAGAPEPGSAQRPASERRPRQSELTRRLSARAVGARRDHPATSPKLLVRRPLNPPVPRTLSRADCTTLGVKGPCEPRTAKGG
ncbi:hypothetical protein IscW_ISCW007379, partial [Ixodes scapularis]